MDALRKCAVECASERFWKSVSISQSYGQPKKTKKYIDSWLNYHRRNIQQLKENKRKSVKEMMTSHVLESNLHCLTISNSVIPSRWGRGRCSWCIQHPSLVTQSTATQRGSWTHASRHCCCVDALTHLAPYPPTLWYTIQWGEQLTLGVDVELSTVSSSPEPNQQTDK